jgi:serine/threonine protein kinase
MWDLGPELRDKWEINRNEIQLIRKLGHGNFGEVYYGKWRNKIEVAVKTLRPGTMSTEAFLQVSPRYTLREVNKSTDNADVTIIASLLIDLRIAGYDGRQTRGNREANENE